MELYEAIRKRYSVREYVADKPVEDETLRKILQAGIDSPSARNRQQRKFIVVQDADRLAKLVEACEQPWMDAVPVIVAVVGLTDGEIMHCRVPTDPVDGAIAIDHMTLAAVAEGLGTCWIGHFDQAKCREILGVPKGCTIIELMTLGYPAGEPKTEKPRHPFDDVVCWERFS